MENRTIQDFSAVMSVNRASNKNSHARQVMVSLLFGASLLPTASYANSQITIDVSTIDATAAADVVVYLEPVDKSVELPLSTKRVEVSQLDRAFNPYVSVVQKGAGVTFTNQDDITHHIYSPVGENKFSFKIKAEQENHVDAFNHVGEVAMGCNIHDWMSGYILVVDTPYFAKTSAEGNVVMSDVIAGEYLLNVWHPQLQTNNNKQSQRITVSKDLAVSVKLTSVLNDIPVQKGDDDFDFLSDY